MSKTSEFLHSFIKEMDLRFTSGNSVPVTQARVTHIEWDSLRRAIEMQYRRIEQLEAQLAKEKVARKEAESEANANEEELAVVEELLYQSRQRNEQLEEQLATEKKARELVQKWRQEATEPDEAALNQPQEAEKAKGEPSNVAAECPTMGRPRKECGCPDCGSSLIDFPSPD